MDDLADPGAQAQLNVATLLEALLQRLLDDRRRGRSGEGLPEGVRLSSQRVVGGKRRSVDEALDVGQCEQVETGDPFREGIDELDELRVGNGAVDVSIPLGELPVEVLAPEQDLERPPATDDRWQTGRGPAPGHGGEPDLELPQHGPLPTGKPDVASEGELAARTASPAPQSGNRHRRRLAQPDEEVRPVVEGAGRSELSRQNGIIAECRVRKSASHSHSFVNLPILGGRSDIALLVPANRHFVFFRVMSLRPINKLPANPQKTPPLRVLLAEDDPVAQLVVRTLLEKQGYVTVLARNSREALARYHAEPFDLMLTDVQMSEMDGVALTDALRSLESTTGAHVPIIGITAHVKKGDREQCLAAGMDGFVPKPILPSVLFREIERVQGSGAGNATGTET